MPSCRRLVARAMTVLSVTCSSLGSATHLLAARGAAEAEAREAAAAPIAADPAAMPSPAHRPLALGPTWPTPPAWPNQPPVLDPVGPLNAVVDRTLVVQLSATDADGDPLQFGAEPLPLPEGFSLDAQTGELRLRPGAELIGTHSLTLLVTDGMDEDREVVTIRVRRPPAHPTGIAGRILDAALAERGIERPIPGVTVRSIENGTTTRTDGQGRFRLLGLPAGENHLDFDGSTAIVPVSPGVPAAGYVGYRASYDVLQQSLLRLERPVYLAPMDLVGSIDVDPTATTLLENPSIGVSVTIPPHTVKDEQGNDYDGTLNLSPVPTEFTPGALPSALNPALVITVQPMGLSFTDPVPVTYPNLDGLPPGNELDLWSLSHAEGRFFKAGRARVSNDGTVIETIEGGILEASWHFAISPSILSQGVNFLTDAIRCALEFGSQADVASGSLTVEHSLVGQRLRGETIAPRLVYRSLLADPRPVVTTTGRIPISSAIPLASSARLEVAGLQQGVELFRDTSGLDENLAADVFHALQFDARYLDSGAYPTRLTLSNHFPNSSVSASADSLVLVRNEIDSPLGAGWCLEGVDRLVETDNGDVLLLDGDGSSLLFRGVEVLLSDEFDTENGGTGAFNYTDFAQWDVIGGCVDLIGAGFFDFYPGNGLYLDMDGNCNQAGVIQSKTAFDLQPGRYELRFDLGGSQRFLDDNTVRVSLGSVYSEDFTREQTAPLEQIVREILVEDAETARLVFAHLNQSDNRGLILDSVELRRFTAGSLTPPVGERSRLVRETDGSYTRTLPDGTVVRFDSEGRKTLSTDRNGNQTQYLYQGGRLDRIVRPLAQQTLFEYESDRLARIVDPVGRTTHLSHDANGDLVEIEDPDGSRRQFAYDPSHRMVAQASRRGMTTFYQYDGFGRLESSSLPDGSGRQLIPRDVVGLVDPQSGVGTLANPAPLLLAEDAVALITDGVGATTLFELDPAQEADRIVDALGRELRFERDGSGALTREILPDGSSLSIRYDAAGRPLEIVREGDDGPSGNDESELYTWHPDYDLVTSFTDAERTINPATGVTTLFEYDAAGNLARRTDALNQVTEFAYDEPGRGVPGVFGLLTSQTEALGLPEQQITTIGYDPLTGNPDRLTQRDRLSRTSYDAAGNIVRLAHEGNDLDAGNDVVWVYSYDVMNRRLTEVGAQTSLSSSYDAAGNLIELRDGKSPAGVWTMEYDARERLSLRRDALGAEERFSYDGEGRLVRHEDRRGQVTTTTWDLLGRRIQDEWPNEPGDPTNETTVAGYDNNQNGDLSDDLDGVASLVNSTASLRFEFDGFGRVVESETTGSTHQPAVRLQYSYDRNGGRASMTAIDPSAGSQILRVDTTRDELGRVTRLSSLGATSRTEYDALSRPTMLIHVNNTRTLVDWAADGTLDRVRHQTNAGMLLDQHRYEFDAVGNVGAVVADRPSLTMSNVRTDYLHDLERQLIDEQASDRPREFFEYDSAGNRTRSAALPTWTHDAADRLTSNGAFDYQSDAAGNRTRRTDTATLDDTDYEYGPRGRLLAVQKPDGTRIEYRYDGLGRRVEKHIDDGVQPRIVRYVYDDEDILLEYEFDGSSDVLVAAYLHGEGEDDPRACVRDLDGNGFFSGSERFAYHTDGLGSVVALSDSQQQVVRSYRYDGFGAVIDEVGTLENPYGFTARERDPESSLNYYRARYYDPASGRFLGEDPLFLNGGDSNPYRYVRNAPLMLRDPTGELALLTLILIGVVGGLIVVGIAALFIFTNPWGAYKQAKSITFRYKGRGALPSGSPPPKKKLAFDRLFNC